jgi:hypothetical protein
VNYDFPIDFIIPASGDTVEGFYKCSVEIIPLISYTFLDLEEYQASVRESLLVRPEGKGVCHTIGVNLRDMALRLL